MAKCIIGVEQEPSIQFTIEADPNNMPQMIILNDDEKLILVGRYASKGNNYSYCRVFNILNYYGEIKEWVKYSDLKG